MFEKEAFEEWKSEQYKDQSTEERLEFVEHLHTFPKYFEKAFKDGYNKANEWHYVKDGDLPKGDMYLVIRLNDENTCYKCCTGFWENDEKCFHTLFCAKVDTKDIIAWKEIVLPKETE